MKKRLVIGLILIFVLPILACKEATGGFASPTPRPPVNEAPTQPFVVPTEAAQPTDTQPAVPTPSKPTEVVEPTATEAPTEVQEPTALPLVPTATTGESGQTGVIDSITLARDTQGTEKTPVNPTTVFPTDAVIHAVVHLKNAPSNTRVTATWFVVDVGSAAEANSKVGTIDITTGGTHYIDFTLSPQPKWPTGSYKVEIDLNGQNVQTLSYTVQ